MEPDRPGDGRRISRVEGRVNPSAPKERPNFCRFLQKNPIFRACALDFSSRTAKNQRNFPLEKFKSFTTPPTLMVSTIKVTELFVRIKNLYAEEINKRNIEITFNVLP